MYFVLYNIIHVHLIQLSLNHGKKDFHVSMQVFIFIFFRGIQLLENRNIQFFVFRNTILHPHSLHFCRSKNVNVYERETQR